MFRKRTADEGQAGDNVGLLLRGWKEEDIGEGQVIAKAWNSQATLWIQRQKFMCLEERRWTT